MARTRKKALWIATESSYGVDPDSDGSDYEHVPCMMLGDLKDGKDPLDTDYFTGRNYPTAPIPGPDGWSFDCEVPVIGLSTAAGDGTNASSVTADWFDKFLAHIFTTVTTLAGEGVGAASTTTNLVLDTDTYSLQDFFPVFEAAVPSAAPRSQWVAVTADAADGTYTVTPTMDTAPTTAGVAYGTKRYTPSDDGGASLAFVYREDEVDYTLLGGRVTSAVISVEAGKIARLKLSISGDSKTAESKGSLAAIVAAPSVTPVRGLVSPVWFNNTKYATRSIELDFGITAAVQEATAGSNGRGGWDSIQVVPKLTIEPLRTDAILNLKRNQTAGRLFAQLGAGVLGSSILNTCAAYWNEATAKVVDAKDENGRIRQTVEFTLSDKVYETGSTASRAFQFSRA